MEIVLGAALGALIGFLINIFRSDKGTDNASHLSGAEERYPKGAGHDRG